MGRLSRPSGTGPSSLGALGALWASRMSTAVSVGRCCRAGVRRSPPPPHKPQGLWGPFCRLLVGAHRDRSCARAPLHVGDPEKSAVGRRLGGSRFPRPWPPLALVTCGLTPPQAHARKSPLCATDRPAGALWPEFLAELPLCSPHGGFHSASHVCLRFQQERKEVLCVSREVFFWPAL